MDDFKGLDTSYFIKPEEFAEQYEKLSKEEEEITKKLESVYLQKSELSRKLSDMTVTLSNVRNSELDLKNIVSAVEEATEASEIISTKMRKIDTGINNVTLCQKRVRDLLDLQLCSEGVQNALNSEDFETAAGHIHRFLSMDQQLLKRAANEMARDCEAVTNAVSLLRDAATMLQNKISLHFKEAVTVNDVPSVQRFFKLFPLVGIPDHGLEQYSMFLCTAVRKFRTEKLEPALLDQNVLFSDHVTQLFEEIAKIIDSNQPIIETYYGAGNLLKIFDNLQKECDTHISYFLQEFRRIRKVDVVVQNINNYSKNVGMKNERLDAKDVDTLLDEVAVIHSRYQLYKKFVQKKVLSDLKSAAASNPRALELSQLKFDTCFNSSATCRQMQELICQYLVLEKYHMEENTKKAIATDTIEEDAQVTSMIDDVFFIIRKCIRRAHTSGNIDAVCAIINNACSLLEIDVCNTMKKKLKQGYFSSYLDLNLTQAYNVMLQGRLQQPDPEYTRSLFLAHLNNTEMCTNYLNTLCQTLRDELRYSTENEKEKLDICITTLNSITSSFTAVNEYGLQQLQVTVVKSRVVPWVDSFVTFNHQLTDEEFSNYETDEPFIRKLITNLDSLFSEFKPRLAASNYEVFISMVVAEIANEMEKVVFKTEFSRMGGLALDKEIRSLISYLSSSTSWSVRDKFTRLLQITTILNLEKVTEISEYLNASDSNLSWKLSPKEVKQILALRKDFRSEDIKKIKF